MKLSLRGVATEARLLLIGIPLLLWTMLPIYHLFLFAISPKDSAFAGNLWPDHPTLRNFAVVFGEQHYYLSHFWRQLFNSLNVALLAEACACDLTRFIALSLDDCGPDSDPSTSLPATAQDPGVVPPIPALADPTRTLQPGPLRVRVAINGEIKSEGRAKTQLFLRLLAIAGGWRRGPVSYYGSGG